jgi:Protein of unknown function (DUF1194)
MSRLPALFFCLLFAGAAAAEDHGREVDLELVLAVDVSRSMNAAEAKLQRDGYVAALSDPVFTAAIKAGMLGRIAVTYVEWAGPASHRIAVEWQVIDSSEAALRFAGSVRDSAQGSARGTSISAALDFSAAQINDNAFDGLRRVIDVSGDGANNVGRPVLEARQDAIEAGITVNGLPILVPGSGTISNLDDYYADCVIGGPGAFSLPARGMAEFALAIRRKLILEVSGGPEATVRPAAARPPVDCLIGEKMRRDNFNRN